MKRWLIQHGVYVVLSLALCGAGVYTLLHLTRDADANSAALLKTQAKLNAAIDALNRPDHDAKGHLQPQGTIQNLNDLIHDARGMITPLNRMVSHEQRRLNTLDGQESAIYDRSLKTLDTFQAAGASARDDLDAAKPAIVNLVTLETALTKSVNGLHPVEAQITALIQEVHPIAANVQQMTANGARITKDAADEADKLVHPAKKKLGFWGGFWVGCQYVHKMMPSIF